MNIFKRCEFQCKVLHWTKLKMIKQKKNLKREGVLVCLRKVEIPLQETLTFNLPLISASLCDYRCPTHGTQRLLSRLSLSGTFNEAPTYCLEVDKNNKLAIWPQGVPAMRSLGVTGYQMGSDRLPEHRKATL